MNAHDQALFEHARRLHAEGRLTQDRIDGVLHGAEDPLVLARALAEAKLEPQPERPRPDHLRPSFLRRG